MWINVKDKLPEKERFYRCWCLGFSKTIKCKFKKGKDNQHGYIPDLFIYKKRIPFVVFWKENKEL